MPVSIFYIVKAILIRVGELILDFPVDFNLPLSGIEEALEVLDQVTNLLGNFDVVLVQEILKEVDLKVADFELKASVRVSVDFLMH